jgi:hypothetical protein
MLDCFIRLAGKGKRMNEKYPLCRHALAEIIVSE